MRRFYISVSPQVDDIIEIGGSEARHMLRVLRLKITDTVMLFDSQGDTYASEIADVGNTRVRLRIIDKKVKPNIDKTEIILCQAITKAKKMDDIVQKCTELGVSTIKPFFSSRSVPVWDSRKRADRVRHWRSIVTAAVKQSGVRKMPVVDEIENFENMVTGIDPGFMKIILWEDEKGTALRDVVCSGAGNDKILFSIGPEGGFTANEIALARENGFDTVGMGDYILRTETAPVAVMAVLRFIKGELG